MKWTYIAAALIAAATWIATVAMLGKDALPALLLLPLALLIYLIKEV